MKKLIVMLLTVGALALGASTPDLALAQGTTAADAKKACYTSNVGGTDLGKLRVVLSVGKTF